MNESPEKVGAMIFPTDDKAKVGGTDTTTGYLKDKIVAGTNISITEQNIGGNETLKIDATVGPSTDEKVKVSANDTTSQYLGQKIQAGTEVSVTTLNPGANEKIQISTNNNKVNVSANDNQNEYLGQKLQAGTNITINTLNPGANEKLQIVATAPVTSVNTKTGAVTLTNTDVGAAATVHTHAAGDITSGTMATARLGTGTADATTFLRGDQTWQAPPGVTGFIGSQNTASPNNTVNASRLLVDAASTNADAVIQPKGTGAILAQLPDNGVNGGNKRGLAAVDLQMLRSNSAQVALGNYSVAIGDSNRVDQAFSWAIGRSNIINTGTEVTLIGQSNTTSGTAATAGAAIGYGNQLNGNACYALGYNNVLGGNNHTCCAVGHSNNCANVSFAFGQGNTAATYGVVIGFNNNASNESYCIGVNAVSNRAGQFVRAQGMFANAGDCQEENYIQRRTTADATLTELSCNGAAPAATTRMSIANDSTYTFHGLITARRADADNESAAWEIKGGIDNNAGTTAFVAAPTITALADDSGGAWTITLVADDTNDCLAIRVTGQVGKTIRWGATVKLMKVNG